MSATLWLWTSTLLLTFTSIAIANEDVALFDSTGKAMSYIALDDEMTIYLWGGKPVAYLEQDSESGYHVYGFNGKHLGWFDKGAIWGHDGKVACAVKEVLNSTQYEPYKAYKQYRPYKAYKQYAPNRPYISNTFSDKPCSFLLGEGGK
jgi:hypothetical protein